MTERRVDGDETPWGAPEPRMELSLPLGPRPVENDTWVEVLPDEALAGGADRYHGRRRARRTTALHRWIAVSAALVALVAAVAIVSAPSGGSRGTMSMPPVPSSVGDSALSATQPASAASATSTATPEATTRTQPGNGPGADSGRGEAPPFDAITLEAEAGSPTTVLTGSARITPDEMASGGQIVTGLGEWDGAGAAGTLKFTGLAIPSAGRHEITLYLTNQDAPGPRTAVISVTGAEPVSMTFAGGPNCCGRRTVEVSLAAGTHAITISNPSGRAPSVDKIVVSRV